MIEKSYRTFVGIFVVLIFFTTPLLITSHHAFATVSSTGVVIPLYVDPGTSWNQVIQAKNAHPSVPIVAVINPNNGPGTSSDPNYVTGIKQLQSAGVIVLGYVHTSYGSRSTTTLESEINSYNNWYHVNGIMFDEMANTLGYETYYSNLSSYVKSLGMTMTMGNPGTDTLPSYIGTVDNLCIYESPGLPTISDLGSLVTIYPKSNFCMIAIGVGQPSQSYITSISNYVSYLYVTGDNLPNPYDTLPSYFNNEVAMLDTSTGSTVPQPPTNLVATAVASSQINLSWTAPSNNGGSAITGYEIERSTNGGSTWSILVANTGSTATTYSNNGLTASSTYTYEVLAINSIGTSSASNTSSATTNASTSNTVSLTVNSVNLSGNLFSGMWIELHASNGTTLSTGYTPVTFNVTSGAQYSVNAANYQNNIFSHWNNGSTNSTITVTPTQNTSLTAYYSTSVTLTVNSAKLSGTIFTGMWTVINSGSTTVKTGYTTLHYTATAGNTYTVTVSNYKNHVFSHWSNGSTSPTITVTPTQNTTLVAYYNA